MKQARRTRADDLGSRSPAFGRACAVARRVVARRADGLATVLGGQLLLVGSGVTVAVAAPLLEPNARGWLALAVTSGLMTLALAATLFLPWGRLPAPATLVFPLLVCLGLVSLEAASPGMAAPLTAVLTLCAAYVGLTHREGTILLLLPASAVTFVVANQGWSRITSVRLVIASVIWTLLAELLARLMTGHRRLSQALVSAAQTDVLTGVGNRREIDLRLAACVSGDVVVICDLDHFKALNDSRGHLEGDRVLADFGAMLRAELRTGDFAGRFGGEEFMMLLPAATTLVAAAVVDRLHESWAVLHPDVTFCAGLASCREDRRVEETVAVADRALYRAKAHGRNCDRAEKDIDEADDDLLPFGVR